MTFPKIVTPCTKNPPAYIGWGSLGRTKLAAKMLAAKMLAASIFDANDLGGMTFAANNLGGNLDSRELTYTL